MSLATAVAGVLIATGATGAILSPPKCGPLEDFAHFMAKYEEIPVFVGRVDESTLMFVSENPVLGTWTLAFATAERACILAFGTAVPKTGAERQE